MSGSDPTEKHGHAMIWFLGILVVVILGAAVQDKPVTIAASDNPPSISTPVTGIDASRTSMRRQGMREQEIRSTPLPPSAQPGSQIFYGGWSVPQ